MKVILTFMVGVLGLVLVLSLSVSATPKVSSQKQDKAPDQTVDNSSTPSGATDGRTRGDASQSGTSYPAHSSSSSESSYGSTSLDVKPPLDSYDPQPVPEPGTLILMSAGLVAVGAGVRRRWKERGKSGQ